MNLNIGVIGCGAVAQRHMNALNSSDQWRLAAVTDLNREQAEAAQARWGAARVCEDYLELLSLEELDAVTVATHVDSHAEIAVAAMEHGLHVLCEKPMADTLEKCRQMVAASERTNRMLSLNFNTRVGTVYRKIKQQIARDVVGPVRVVRFVYDWSNHHWTPPQRLQHFMKNGGPIIDSGVHFFEGIRWFTGQEFSRIDATGVMLPPHAHPQHVIATCQLSGGAIGLVEAGWLYCKHTADDGKMFQVTVIGDDGTIDYDLNRRTIQIFGREGTEEIPCTDLDKHFDTVYELFAQSIGENRLIELASADDGLKATQAAYAALDSAHQSQCEQAVPAS